MSDVGCQFSNQAGQLLGAHPDSGRDLLRCVRKHLGHLFQPVVNIHTGCVYGYEALLHGLDTLGLTDLADLIQAARERLVAGDLDLLLREMAIARFAEIPNAHRYRLFFNLDPSLLDADRPIHTIGLLKRHGLGAETLCLEISERAELLSNPSLAELIGAYRQHRFHLAIDDFGSGHAGLRLLYEHPPHLLKIDRFFIRGIAEDPKKRIFVSHTVQLAHVLGILVIAEGVESETEFLACREIGCDLAQGHLIAHPQSDIARLPACHEHIAALNARHQHRHGDDRALIKSCLEFIPPLHVTDNVTALFEAFRQDKAHHMVPVLDGADRPLGLIHESDIKDFIYSAYGRDLLSNRALGRTLRDFVRPCPSVDIHDSAERLLDAYSANVNPAGLFVTENARYLGFISATALLQLIEQKNLAAARDQNPLTKLPGNNPIFEFVSRALSQPEHGWHLAYFDFDNFKAFNDHYGFRRGDRAILMFAELLRKQLGERQWFIGHVGGDDFFAGIRDADRHAPNAQISELLEKFRSDVQSLYDPDDSHRGFIRARDRFGESRDMPLMRASAALLVINPGDDYGNAEHLGQVIAEMKHEAKASPSGLVVRDSAMHLALDTQASQGCAQPQPTA